MTAPAKRGSLTPGAEARMARVTTIDKCLDILEALRRAEQGLGVRPLARQLDLNVASVHNMCHTLCQRGYLWQDPRSKRFHLGLALALLGQSDPVWQRLVAAAEPIARRCQEELDESILLATLSSTEIVTLTYHPSSQALRVHEPHTMGARAYGTAVGKVLLSAMTEEQLTAYLHQFPPYPFTPDTIVDPQQIRAELEQVRERGFGETREELTLGVSAVAVPVLDPGGQLFAALGASAPSLRMNSAGMRATRDALARYASMLQQSWFDHPAAG